MPPVSRRPVLPCSAGAIRPELGGSPPRIPRGQSAGRQRLAAPIAACAFAGLAALAALAITGCSPVFNWRELALDADGAQALLPCKPDRAARQLASSGEAVTLEMSGCSAGGAVFSVARAVARDAAQADAWRNEWAQAMRGKLTEATAKQSPFAAARAAIRPAPLRLDVQGADGQGQATALAVLWLAYPVGGAGDRPADGGPVALIQATVLGKPEQPDSVSTFFEGLRLP